MKKIKLQLSSTIKARYSGGVLKPLEPVELEDGEEVTVTISGTPKAPPADWLERTAGSWVGLNDPDKLKRDIYESRVVQTREEPRL